MRGGNTRIYVDDAVWSTWLLTGPATLEEVCEIADSNLNRSKAESERRTRCSDHTGVNPGRKNPEEISFDYMPNEAPTPNDSVYALLDDSFENDTILSVAYCDGDREVADTQVIWWGEMVVTGFDRTDGDDAESTIAVVLKASAVRETGSPETNKITALA